jgi:hypothetical protein
MQLDVYFKYVQLHNTFTSYVCLKFIFIILNNLCSSFSVIMRILFGVRKQFFECDRISWPNWMKKHCYIWDLKYFTHVGCNYLQMRIRVLLCSWSRWCSFVSLQSLLLLVMTCSEQCFGTLNQSATQKVPVLQWRKRVPLNKKTSTMYIYMYKQTCLFKCGRRGKKIKLLHWTIK